jgi:hypothetical protein
MVYFWTSLFLYLVSDRIHLGIDSGTENSVDHKRYCYEDGYANCVLGQLRPLLVLKKINCLFHQATPLNRKQ